jgi:hypothetical protein
VASSSRASFSASTTEPRDLRVVQVGHLAVAAQLEVALEQFAQRVGRAHDQVEGRGLLDWATVGASGRRHARPAPPRRGACGTWSCEDRSAAES